MIISKTPYRISFFGGGTDYPEWVDEKGGGSVISTSIDKYCYITCRFLPPFFEQRHRIVWSKIELVSEFDEITHPAIRECMKFLGFEEDKGIEIHHQGDLPARSGIGSSSSFIVGMIKSLYALKHKMISNYELATQAIHFEKKVLMENVGCQDQVAAAYGGLNRIDFMPGTNFCVRPLTVDFYRQKELQENLMLFFTGTTRIASNIAKDIVANLSKRKEQLMRLQQMVEDVVGLIGSGSSLDVFGEMLHESWKYKKELSDLISNEVIDAIYTRAMKCGALGGKLLGAGSSGFMLFYVPLDFQESVKREFSDLVHVPFSFDREGSTIIHYSNIEDERIQQASYNDRQLVTGL